MKISDSRYGAILSVPGLTLLLVWVLIPFFYLFYLSFLRYDNLSPVVPSGFANYETVLKDPALPLILTRTFIFAFGSTGLTFVTSLLLALCLNKIVKGSTFFRSLVIMPWAVPLVLSGFLWAWMFHPSFGPISDMLMKLKLIAEPVNIYEKPHMAMLGVIVADAWRRIPFLTIIALAALQAVPYELYDAAKVDGADSFHIFKYVSMPLVSRPVLIGTLITLMFSFRSIDVIYSMTPGGGYAKSTYVLGIYLFDYMYEFLNFGVAASASVILIIFTLAIGSFFIYYTLKKR
jgi:multiple sugar transport system permease protein